MKKLLVTLTFSLTPDCCRRHKCLQTVILLHQHKHQGWHTSDGPAVPCDAGLCFSWHVAQWNHCWYDIDMFFYLYHNLDSFMCSLFLKKSWQMTVYVCVCVSSNHTGLCGNFNNIMSDDFRVISGLVEGTAAAFANTWKTRACCPDIQTRFGDPCSQGISKGTAIIWWG